MFGPVPQNKRENDYGCKISGIFATSSKVNMGGAEREKVNMTPALPQTYLKNAAYKIKSWYLDNYRFATFSIQN